MPNYEFNCQDCGHNMLLNLPVDERDNPTKEPCPKCGKMSVKRPIALATLNYSAGESMYKKAGNGWKELQQRIKAASGRNNTIRTK